MEIDFAAKVALVTGACRGIGRDIAQESSESGARVAIDYRRNARSAEQTLAENWPETAT
ncbi:MAG: SDR family NAD(P)-dependent oxidoreductase [Planctomycetota bacterium]|jgi:3-oxoacyl-[acyl-carrier protein] reductase